MSRIRNVKQNFETPDELGWGEGLKAKIREHASQKKGIILQCGAAAIRSLLRGVSASCARSMPTSTTFCRSAKTGKDIAHVAEFKRKRANTMQQTIARAIVPKGT